MTVPRPMLRFVPALCLTALAACSQTDDPGDADPGPLGPGDVAIVNGVRIPESVYRTFALGTRQRDVREMSETERGQIVEELIRIRLLAETAETNGYADERAVAARLRIQRDQVLANEAATRYVEDNPATEAELRAAYEEAVAGFAEGEYKARHILLDTEEEAREIIALLDAGGDFAALADERSNDTAGNGGDVGWITRDSTVPQFADAVTALEVGRYTSEPVETQFGWHVILLEDSREQEPPGLEAMRAELAAGIQRRKVEAFIEDLREAADVETFQNGAR